MKSFQVLMLPGDGIGPEVAEALLSIIDWYRIKGIVDLKIESAPVGGTCYDLHGVSIQEETMAKAAKSDAILFGAVGGVKWQGVPYEHRPEAGLLRMRKEFQLFANIRPAFCFPALVNASTLKKEHVQDLDLIILRECAGGVYFGEPKEIRETNDGKKIATDNQIYHSDEIVRVARVAFGLARARRNKVTSVEKHNVMKTGILWKEIVSKVHREEFSDVELEHMLADNCAMQLVRRPKQFDVIVTDNLFGDILSDEAAMLTGSLGMLPSASLGESVNGRRRALYEPVHGSAPDIAGKDFANPLAMVGSLSMAMKYSFDMSEDSKKLDQAINRVLAKNIRTRDIAEEGSVIVGTKAMAAEVIKELGAIYV